MNLPQLLPVPTIAERLERIFPEGTANRLYVTRLMAARTVYVMLYIGAVDGTDRWLAPKQVYLMGDAQANLQTDQDRLAYAIEAARPRFIPRGPRWYADNTREPIRDETLKEGLVRAGAVVVRRGIATTSSQPRYALEAQFAALFDPQVTGQQLAAAIQQWQVTHLDAPSLARIQILRQKAVTIADQVQVRFPNGEIRQLEAGPSAFIAKAVVEEFAPRFLEEPVVLWLSESGNKVVARDDQLIQAIGLRIEADKLLPDLMLYDLSAGQGTLVFVEVVASDRPINDSRRQGLLTIAQRGNFAAEQIAFITAYLDRDHPAFKKTVAALAWQTFAWFASEPDHIILLRQGGTQSRRLLSELLR